MNLVTAIGNLLANRELRADFRQDPARIAAEMGLAEREQESLLALDTEDLERQAKALLAKRWHTTCELIPETISNLGDQARGLFWFYANQDWPGGHRRHAIDAREFLKFLRLNKLEGVSSRELKHVRQLARGAG